MKLCLSAKRTALVAIGAALWASLAAAEEVREVVVSRTEQAPVIDGKFDDASWQHAGRCAPFLVAGGDEPARQQTGVRIVFTTEALYLAFECKDSEIVSTPRKHGDKVWYDDCVEVFFSPERKPDKVHHFVVNVDGARTWKRADERKYKPGVSWKAATQKSADGWTAEIEIPFKSFLVDRLRPRRGDLWGMKLTREDYAAAGGRAVEMSSWTAIGKNFSDPSAFGDLVFESRNLLANGGAEIDKDGDNLPDGWRFRIQGQDGFVDRPPNVRLDETARAEGRRSLRVARGDGNHTYITFEPVDLKPGVPHQFSVKLRLVLPNGALPRARITFGEGNQIVVRERFEDFKAVTLCSSLGAMPHLDLPAGTQGTGAIWWVDDARLEIASEYTEPGIRCLTGNEGDGDGAPGGAYTYHEGHARADFFPYYPLETTENGRSSGWLSFKAGKLTDGDRQNMVTWPMYYIMGHEACSVEFDLKRDYWITRIEVYSLVPSIGNCQLYLKPDGGELYTRAFLSYHPNVPSMPRRAYVRIGKVNAAARRVRLNMGLSSGKAGLSEVFIWGKDLEDREPLVEPCKLPGETKTEAIELAIAEPPKLPLFPMPQEFKEKSGRFTLDPATRILFVSSDDRARATAEVLRDEIRYETGVEIASIGELPQGPLGALKNAMIVGEPSKDKRFDDWVRKLSLALPKDSPQDQGYVLDVSPDVVVIAGCGPEGTFNGCMTLLQLVAYQGGHWCFRGARIRDWPDQPYRGLMYELSKKDDASIQRFFRAMARLKLNTILSMLNEPEKHVPIAEKYFVKVSPNLNQRSFMTFNNLEFVERYPGEDLAGIPGGNAKTGGGKWNVCPSNPKWWRMYEATAAKILPKYNGEFVNINMHEMGQLQNGSRWNVCSLCRARNMHGHELLAATINRIQDIFDKYDKRVLLFATFYGPGISYPGDAENDWEGKAPPLCNRKVANLIWRESGKAPGGIGERMAAMGFTTLSYEKSPGPHKYKGQQGIWVGFRIKPFNAMRLLHTAHLGWSPNKFDFGTPEFAAWVEKAMVRYNGVATGTDSPLHRSGDKEFFTLDLREVANRSFVDETAYDGKGWIDEGPTRDLRALKTGRRALNGVPFDLIGDREKDGRQCVMLHNPAYFNRALPHRVSIPLGRKAASLVFLHALDRAPAQASYKACNSLAGAYFMVYDDDTCVKYEINRRLNCLEWDNAYIGGGIKGDARGVDNGFLAWRGMTLGGQMASLYATEWVNPYPDRPIKRILFMATQKLQSFNPILIAATAIEPSPRDLELWRDKRVPLHPVADLAPQRPSGKPIDFANGRDESELAYVAPDGARFELERADNRHGIVSVHKPWHWAGHLVSDGNWAPRGRNTIAITFPKARPLCCVGLFGSTRDEDNYFLNYLPYWQKGRIDYQVHVSKDGKSFAEIGKATAYNPDDQGWRYHHFPAQPVKSVRIEIQQTEGQKVYGGIATVRLYEPN